MASKSQKPAELGPDFRVELSEERLWQRDRLIPVRRRLFSMLRLFVRHPGQLLTKEEILEHVWPTSVVTDELVKDYVHSLRQILCDSPSRSRYIETVRGRGYRYLGGIEVVTEIERTNTRPSEHESRPRIAVIPLAQGRCDVGGADFADGLVDNVRIELTRFSTVHVVASTCSNLARNPLQSISTVGRQLAADFIVVCAVRRADERMRVSAQLVQAENACILWAEHYDGDIGNALALQANVARMIASAVEGRLQIAMRKFVACKAESELTPHNLIIRGQGIVATTQADNKLARRYFERACEADPMLARAFSGLAHSYVIDARFGHEGLRKKPLDEAFKAAVKAQALDPVDSKTQWVFGHVLDTMGEHEEAEVYFERALELNPMDTDALGMRGLLLKNLGRPLESIHCFETAMHLDPHFRGWHLWNLGAAYNVAGQNERSLGPLKRFTRLRPNHVLGLLSLTNSFAQLGRLGEAGKMVERVLKLKPDVSLSREWDRMKGRPHADQYLEGLRKAGIPG